jgi:NAD+ diphosphatase
MTRLTWLALARGPLDRVSYHRNDPEWLAAAWQDPESRVLVIDRGRALVTPEPALVLLSPAEAPGGDIYLLGVDEDDVAYFAVTAPLPELPGAVPAGLREAGANLGDRDAGLLTHAAALSYWHATHRFCPRCGSPTEIASAGHVRVCAKDGSEHYPRVDPAIIVAIVDDSDRLLLARGAAWPEHRMSILAGFVEPGESLEQTVAREVREEVGILVTDFRYAGSQPWPLPRSLMLGYFARAHGDQLLEVDGEEILEAYWFSRPELLAAVESGDLLLPGRVSIARQLIESWYGGPLPGDW